MLCAFYNVIWRVFIQSKISLSLFQNIILTLFQVVKQWVLYAHYLFSYRSSLTFSYFCSTRWFSYIKQFVIIHSCPYRITIKVINIKKLSWTRDESRNLLNFIFISRNMKEECLDRETDTSCRKNKKEMERVLDQCKTSRFSSGIGSLTIIRRNTLYSLDIVQIPTNRIGNTTYPVFLRRPIMKWNK